MDREPGTFEDLLPCPFCGGGAHVYLAGDGPAERSAWKYNIECDHLPECPISTSGGVVGDLDACSDDLDKLTESWNRRAERTCRYVRDHMGVAGNWFCKCSECGAEFDERVVDSHFVYCPECGARVIGEETGDAD